jgi:hypothetical protein
MSKRPSWIRGYKQSVLQAQNHKCAYCGEALQKENSELHHDYKGHNWALIRGIAESDSLKALGFEGKLQKRMIKHIYHDTNSIKALHPKCHVQADTAQREGLVEQAKRAKA